MEELVNLLKIKMIIRKVYSNVSKCRKEGHSPEIFVEEQQR
ncbi:MAG: hypothetical protein H6Q18_1080 [Bacteroidetes bacterium]|nr:hypothetical protein [Bacteroidota bacterium]